MTDDTEHQLRTVLRDRAQAVTVSGDPVALVDARMRQRFRRHSIGAAATAAVGVTALAVGVNAFGASRTPARPAGPPVVASELSPTATPSSSTPSTPTSSPTASVPASVGPAPNVAAVQLPPGYRLDGVMAGSDGLVVTGTTESTEANPPCVLVPVSTAPLALGVITTSSCPDPASLTRPVVAVLTRSIVKGNDTGFVSIARFDSATGNTTTGPVVMTYSPASDTQPVLAYGVGSLWIYDLATTNGPEAIAVSLASGAVQDIVRTPPLDEPVIAANNDGLWLGNSIRGAGTGPTLLHIAPGSHTVTTVVPAGGKAVDWLLADQGHLWAGIRAAGAIDDMMWRFDGSNATVAFQTDEPRLSPGTTTVVGSENDGLWAAVPYPAFGASISPDANKELDVLRIDPDTGHATVEATLPALPELSAETGASPGSIIFYDGAFFVLEPSSQPDALGYSSLTRVTPLK